LLFFKFLLWFLGFSGKKGSKIQINSWEAKNLIAIFERRSAVEKC